MTKIKYIKTSTNAITTYTTVWLEISPTRVMKGIIEINNKSGEVIISLDDTIKVHSEWTQNCSAQTAKKQLRNWLIQYGMKE